MQQSTNSLCIVQPVQANQEFYFSITYVFVHRLGKVKSLPLHRRSLKILIKLIDIDVILPKLTMRT